MPIHRNDRCWCKLPLELGAGKFSVSTAVGPTSAVTRENVSDDRNKPRLVIHEMRSIRREGRRAVILVLFLNRLPGFWKPLPAMLFMASSGGGWIDVIRVFWTVAE